MWSISNNEWYPVYKRICVYLERIPRDASEYNRASRLFHEINFWGPRTSHIQIIWESFKEESASLVVGPKLDCAKSFECNKNENQTP